MVPAQRRVGGGVGGLREIDRLDERQDGLALVGTERLPLRRSGRVERAGARHRRRQHEHTDETTAAHRERLPYLTAAFSNDNASTAASAWWAVRSGCSGVTDT